MIISASYKTDIPTFYGDWFLNRLRAGYCKMTNPYNGQVYRVDLAREAVDGIVFWTKNVGPFLGHLEEVRERGYSFVVQYTINAYPRELEVSVADALRSVEYMKMLSARFSPKVAVWRYDTIVFSSLTPIDFHRRNFDALARSLEGTTNEVVVSFAQIYRKTVRNMNRAARESGFEWEDPPDEVKYGLATELAEMAKACGMQLSMCSQRQYLASGVSDARCVDAQRLSQISGHIIVAEQRGNRKDCGCFAAKDIGEYDTCPHGCIYCYAVHNRRLAQQRYKAHDPNGEFLFTPTRYDSDQSNRGGEEDAIQGRLF